MFGIGPTEMVVIAVLVLIIFGPSKMPQMARDIGKFVGQARGAIDEFKEELTAEGADDTKDNKNRPARSREEGSRRRKDGQNGASSSSREDEHRDEEDAEGSSQTTSRERAEYDL